MNNKSKTMPLQHQIRLLYVKQKSLTHNNAEKERERAKKKK